MVVKFGMQQTRGAAGQTAMGPKNGYNFANLYNQNQATDQVDRKLSSMKQGANQVQQLGIDGRQKATGRQDKAGDIQGGQSLMSSAVNQAKGISNQAQNFSTGANMMKAGASPYQSAVGSFYAGGQNGQSSQKIRKFGGLYSQTLGKQDELNNSINAGIGNSIITTPGKVDKGPTAYERDVAKNDNLSQAKYTLDDKGTQTRSNPNDLKYTDDLMWAYKTGKISEEQFRKAQNDPAYYDSVMKGVNG